MCAPLPLWSSNAPSQKRISHSFCSHSGFPFSFFSLSFLFSSLCLFIFLFLISLRSPTLIPHLLTNVFSVTILARETSPSGEKCGCCCSFEALRSLQHMGILIWSEKEENDKKGKNGRGDNVARKHRCWVTRSQEIFCALLENEEENE